MRHRPQGVVAIEGVQEYGHGGRVPVVGMEDIGGEADHPGQFHGGPGKENEPVVVVRVADVVFLVEPFPTVVTLVLKEVDRHVGARKPPLPDAAVLIAHDPHGDHEHAGKPRQSVPLRVDPVVARHHHPHIVPHAGQVSGQHPHHVRKPPLLGEGDALGCGHEDVQSCHIECSMRWKWKSNRGIVARTPGGSK
mgnify:CR=1 FL=1